MDIIAVGKLLWRQRLIAVIAAALSLVLVVIVVMKAPPKYESSGSVVLLLPPLAPDAAKLVPGTDEAKPFENPYVRFNDTSVVVDILRRVMASDQVAERLRSKGVTGQYVVAANIDFYRGPIMDIKAEAYSPEQAMASADAVIDELEVTLAEMQAAQGTDPVYSFKADVVVPPTKAKRIITGTLRRAIAGGAVGGFMVLGSAVAADALLKRKRPGSLSAAPGHDGTPGQPPAPPIEVAFSGNRLSVVQGRSSGSAAQV